MVPSFLSSRYTTNNTLTRRLHFPPYLSLKSQIHDIDRYCKGSSIASNNTTPNLQFLRTTSSTTSPLPCPLSPDSKIPSHIKRAWNRIDGYKAAVKLERNESSRQGTTRYEQEALRHPTKEQRADNEAKAAKISEQKAEAAKAALPPKTEEEQAWEDAEAANAFGNLRLN